MIVDRSDKSYGREHMTLEQVLAECELKGNVVELPDKELHPLLYSDVSKWMRMRGGKWNRKALGFEFPDPPKDLENQLKGGKQ